MKSTTDLRASRALPPAAAATPMSPAPTPAASPALSWRRWWTEGGTLSWAILPLTLWQKVGVIAGLSLMLSLAVVAFCWFILDRDITVDLDEQTEES